MKVKAVKAWALLMKDPFDKEYRIAIGAIHSSRKFLIAKFKTGKIVAVTITPIVKRKKSKKGGK